MVVVDESLGSSSTDTGLELCCASHSAASILTRPADSASFSANRSLRPHPFLLCLIPATANLTLPSRLVASAAASRKSSSRSGSGSSGLKLRSRSRSRALRYAGLSRSDAMAACTRSEIVCV